MQTGSSFDERVAFEVARRLDRLTEDPERLMRYDANGDGVLDSEEWEVVRALVRRRVARELQDERGTLPASDDRDDVDAREVLEGAVDPPHPAPREADTNPTPAMGAHRTANGVVVDDSLDDEWGVDTDPHIDLTVRERLSDRYDVLHELGRGAQGNTYLGRDLSNNRFVAIKELAIGRIDDWKSLELFEREQSILAQLDHPNIPGFVDTWEVDSGGKARLFLIQEFIEGETLDAEIERSNFDDSALYYVAEQVLQTLVYLQELTPPVIHRDIKPANLIRRSDGRVMVVDFGGVQTRNSIDDVGGSTVVGTTGYMPPEQLMGRANETTDLFALGATLIHLVTGHHPSRIPQQRSKYQWHQYASVGPQLTRFIDRLTEPIAEDRFPDAQAALTALTAPAGGDWSASSGPEPDTDPSESKTAMVVSKPSEVRLRRPDNSFVSVERTADSLNVRIPASFSKRRLLDGGILLLISILVIVTEGVAGPWFSLGCGLFLAAVALWNLLLARSSFIFEATPTHWKSVEKHWGIPFESTGKKAFNGARVDRRERRNKGHVTVYYVLQVQAGHAWHNIEAGVTKPEKDWVAAEMNAFASDAKKIRAAERARKGEIGLLD